MPGATADAILDRVRNCHGVCEVRVNRLGGLLGSKMVEGCGAFPDQDPRKIKVSVETSGWFHPEDFMD
jgi:hypothetical protein